MAALQAHASAFSSIPLKYSKDPIIPLAHGGSPSLPHFGRSSANTHGQPAPRPSHLPAAAPSSAVNAQRMLKRRYEDDDLEPTRRDVTMDRSPTPDRPRTVLPKRARVQPHGEGQQQRDQHGRDSKPQAEGKDDDVDAGLLLASLPSDSLLPLINALLTAQPTLKPVILSLIPRPTLQTAIQSINSSSKRLRDAYPYSTSSPFSQLSTTPFSSSSSFGSTRANGFGASTMGFGFGQQAHHSVFPPPASTSSDIRPDYVLSRLRPHVSDFVSTTLSYLPYFSLIFREPSSSDPTHFTQAREKPSPTETFQLLQALTSQVLNQPPLTQSALVPALMPRLADEWRAWVERVDVIANREAGMFGQETVQSWLRALDEYARAKDHGMDIMRDIRSQWLSKVGWLLGPQPHPEAMVEM